MTTDQEAENVAASVRHLMTQRGKDAENWQRQARDWEAQCVTLRGERDNLLLLVGTETPIAAFDLVTTWRAEKAGYMERVVELERKIGIAERMARYLGWAFEQKLIHPNETAELLGQVLREWKAGVADADLL